MREDPFVRLRDIPALIPGILLSEKLLQVEVPVFSPIQSQKHPFPRLRSAHPAPYRLTRAGSTQAGLTNARCARFCVMSLCLS